jgi:hypothetical protein
MRTWIAEGRIGPDCLVWREGWRDWQQAADVLAQLRSQAMGPDLGAVGRNAATSAGAARRRHRRSSRGHATVFNAAMITVLILAVIVLLGVFLWVLKSGTEPPGDASTRAPMSVASRLDDGQLGQPLSAVARGHQGA